MRNNNSPRAETFTIASDPRYMLEIKRELSDNARERERDDEVWLLLSQHVVSKDRPMDDTALHVFEEHTSGSRAISCHRAADMVSACRSRKPFLLVAKADLLVANADLPFTNAWAFEWSS